MKMKDFDNLQNVLDKSILDAVAEIKKIDFAKIQKDIESSLKAVDMEKIMADVSRSLKAVDMDKLLAEVKSSLNDIDLEGKNEEIEKALKEAKKYYLEKYGSDVIELSDSVKTMEAYKNVLFHPYKII